MTDAQIQAFLKFSKDWIGILDPKGRIQSFNKTWAKTLEIEETKIENLPLVDFIHPEDRTNVAKSINQVLTTENQESNFKCRIKAPNKQFLWIEWDCFHSEGHAFIIGKDITDHELLKRYYKEIQDVANIGYWRIDLATNTPLWSDKTYEIHGIPVGSEVDMSAALDFYPGSAREKISELVTHGINNGVPWDAELPFVTADKRNLWVRAMGKPVMENGKTVEVYGVFQDISEKKNIETQLRYFAHEIGDGIWDWHIEKDYEYMSPRFWSILGYKPEEKKHHPSEWQELIFPEDLDKALKHFNMHVATRGVHPFWLEARYKHKDGSTVWVVCQGKVVEWDEKGNPIRMIGTHTDITQLKSVQLRLSEATKLASLGEMAGGIAHEINNPLTIISASAKVIKACTKKLDENQKKKIIPATDAIESTVKRISNIISGMKNLMRSEDLKSMEIQNLGLVVQDTLSLCKESVQSKGIEFRVKGHIDHKVLCNPTQISQIILNLVTNSKHAIVDSQNPWIEISLKTEGSTAWIQVTDSGKGIQAENVDRLFEPFFTTKPVGAGTGLGLSIAREIAQKHNGDLIYKNDEENTCFILKIPVLENEIGAA